MRLLISCTVYVALCCFSGSNTSLTDPSIHSNTPGQSGSGGLFDSDSVLNIRLTGKVSELFNDRKDDALYHPLLMTYQKNDTTVHIPLKAKTRGNFRRRKENCTFPPILLNFTKNLVHGTLFEQADKVKLVCPCRGENFVVREYLVYKLYNLLTTQSFKARLARVTFEDTERNKEITFYGILLEEDDQMAKRNQSILIHRLNTHGESIETASFLRMAMFQYLIGNTDWSTEYFQNTRLIAFDSLSIPSVVPYDFDHSGLVSAPYAYPAEELALSSVRERRYRGYCIPDMRRLDEVIALYNSRKKDLYSLYSNCTLLDSKYIRATLQYFDEFYGTINDPKKLKTAFMYPCNKNVPNIVIRGLGKN